MAIIVNASASLKPARSATTPLTCGTDNVPVLSSKKASAFASRGNASVRRNTMPRLSKPAKALACAAGAASANAQGQLMISTAIARSAAAPTPDGSIAIKVAPATSVTAGMK